MIQIPSEKTAEIKGVAYPNLLQTNKSINEYQMERRF
jgi:hypothetical protein